jgi:hypothetical protein
MLSINIANSLVALFVPLIIYGAMWPLHRTPYDWDKLFLMQAVQPRPSDIVYTHEDNSDIGEDWDPPALARAARNAKIVCVVVVLIFLIIIPFSLYGTGYSFSRNFFTGWTVVVFLWSFTAAATIWFLPLWQSRATLIGIFKGMVGKKHITETNGHDVSDVDQEHTMVSKGDGEMNEEKKTGTVG